MVLLEFLDLLLLLLLWRTSPTQATEEAPLVAVYAVRGQTARLPCNLTTEPEDPVILVLWYKNGTKTPVFSVDSRARGQRESSGSTRVSDVFKGRATLQESRRSWALEVRQVEFSDQGEYRCRLDFQSSPTHNARVHLHVVDLPRQLRIYSPGGALIDEVAAVQEGHPLTLSCRATGGEPLPNVTWWSGSTLLDAEAEERQGGPSTTSATPTTTTTTTAAYVTNTLNLAAVTRHHLTHNLTCMATNTPVLPSLIASVLLIQTDSRLEVQMTAPSGTLSGGHQYDIKCEASGVRPAPVLTWWLRGQRLTRNTDVQTLGLDSTVSRLRLLASAGDDGSLLECRAAAPTLPHLTATDSTRLTVHYVPEATISLARVGGEVGTGSLRAGDSATLTCAARANPPAYNFTFLFNGRPLHRANVVRSGRSLTLLQLSHRDAGLYTCVASNPEGDGQSNAVTLHIDYAPVCEWEGAREVLAVAGEMVEMDCRVRASPPQVSYIWESVTVVTNMDQVRAPIRHKDEGLTSIGWVKADNVSSGSQRAECQSSNAVGPADHPCIFSILLVEKPSTLIGCYYHDVTTDSAAVTCSPGTNSGQLPETYHIEVREGGKVVAAYNNSKPRFNMTSLAPGRDYVLAMYASHAKGRGHLTTLLMKTHAPKAEQVAPERVSVNLNKHGDVSLTPTEPPRSGVGAPVSVVVSGVVGVVVGVAVVVAGIVTCRVRRAHASSPGKTHQQQNARQDSLLELPHAAVYQSCSSSHPSCELLTTFSPGPVVVTQVTPGRRASTRSANEGTSPRAIRARTPSTRGGPVHVVEVEADDITTPTVEIESPSRLSRLSLRDDALNLRDSPPISLHCEALQQPLPQAGPQSGSQGGPQNGAAVDPQLASTHHAHLSSQSYSPLQAHSTSQPLAATQHPQQQIHTVNLPHTMPSIQLIPQVPTATLPQTGTLPRTSSKAHTATLPQTAILHTALPPHTTDTLPRTASQSHTATQPHAATLPQAATTLTQLASQVHSAAPPQTHIDPQSLTASQSRLFPRPSEGIPQESHSSQTQTYPQLQTVSDPSLHPELTSTHQHHSSSPDSTSIKLHPTFR
ncbi:uncharacterized protein [Panulirus ornatus]|uniref:uncharacterized protein n=1 Tax=Panulirus ornatus TaxID=150431 RepID=UPI003A855A77